MITNILRHLVMDLTVKTGHLPSSSHCLSTLQFFFFGENFSVFFFHFFFFIIPAARWIVIFRHSQYMSHLSRPPFIHATPLSYKSTNTPVGHAFIPQQMFWGFEYLVALPETLSNNNVLNLLISKIKWPLWC